jgi:hypothetical protein
MTIKNPTPNPLVVFSLSIFLGSWLLFGVQPLFSRMVLPSIGGAPNVWITLMVFFQATLLAGYAYAHGLRRLPTRWQQGIHAALVLGALVFLPLSLPDWPPPDGHAFPMGWILALGVVSVGLPFFVLAANAPLMQAWFGNTGHPQAGNPYFLYATSNAGSLIALLGYPFIVEPLLPLDSQVRGWSLVFAAFVLLLPLILRYARQQVATARTTPAPSARTITLWVALAAVPSSLMMSVTTYMTQIMAAVPLLWIVPLSLYLLTFILAFARRRLVRVAGVVRLLPWLLACALTLTLLDHGAQLWTIGLHIGLFFAITLACHLKLSDTAPPAEHLTAFYLWMSFGGMLGGIVNALIAPVIFVKPLEHPLGLAAACLLLLPLGSRKILPLLADVALPALVCGLLVLSMFRIQMAGVVLPQLGGDTLTHRLVFVILIAIIVLASAPWRALRVGVLTAGALGTFLWLPTFSPDHEMSRRSFFGVYDVVFQPHKFSYALTTSGQNTVQGRQSVLPMTRLDTTHFYPLEGVTRDLPLQIYARPAAVIGLGVGTIACLNRTIPQMTFFEIDPVVHALASQTDFFTFLRECPTPSRVVLGDGRLKLAELPARSQGIIVLDAFNGAAIPTHLLTVEALDVYLSKLAPEGILLINLTNANLTLKPLVAALAHARDLTMLERLPESRRRSEWVVLTFNPAAVTALTDHGLWRPYTGRVLRRPWRDGYTPILSLLRVFAPDTAL